MMRIMASIALMLVVCLMAVITGCNDKGANLLTGSQTSLASESLGKMVTITTKTGEGPEVISQVQAVKWDGESEVEEGVVYQFSCVEELVAAFSSVPGFLENYEKAKASENASGKMKANAEAELASDNEWAGATCEVYGGGSSTYCEARGGVRSIGRSFTFIVDAGNGSVGRYGYCPPWTSAGLEVWYESCPEDYEIISHSWVYAASAHDSNTCY